MKNFSANALTSGTLKVRNEETNPAACRASTVLSPGCCGGKYILYHLLIYLRDTVNIGNVVTAFSFFIHRNIIFLYFTWGSKEVFENLFLTGCIIYFTAPSFSFLIFLSTSFTLIVSPLSFTPEKECKTDVDIISILGFTLQIK